MFHAVSGDRVEGVHLRLESAQDEEFLLGLYASTRAAEMRLTGWTRDQQRQFMRWQFDLQRKHYGAHYSGAEFNVVMLGDVPVGRMYVLRQSDEFRLIEITIEPQFRGRGIGTSLIRNLQDDAERANVKVTLHAEPGNPAVRLYQRLGFTAVEQRGMNLFFEWRPLRSRE
jgi:ribosomal protein S18 acetylase RimI-like enzyme